jgi:hypothetical protein
MRPHPDNSQKSENHYQEKLITELVETAVPNDQVLYTTMVWRQKKSYIANTYLNHADFLAIYAHSHPIPIYQQGETDQNQHQYQVGKT